MFVSARALCPAVCGALLACATAAPPRSAQGWSTRQSNHFLIHSDAGDVAMQATAKRLEEVYAALSRSFFGDANVPLVEVMVFYDPAHYRALIGDSAGAFYDGVGRTGSVLVMNDQQERAGLDHLVAHELTHRFVASLYATLPNWLSEGLAMFFESVVVDNDRLEFGAAPREGVHGFAAAGGVGFADLLAVRPARLYGNEARFYYTASWGLVHYLFTAEDGALRARLPQLLATINEALGDPRRIQRAFATIYPEKSPADFDAAIERNNRRVRGPALDRLLRMSFTRPGAPRLTALPDAPTEQTERDEVVRLFHALQDRRGSRRDTRTVLLARPRYLRAEIDLDLLNRPRYVGVGAGRMLAPRTSVEADLGFGGLGLTVGPRVRQFFQLGEDGNFFLTAGAGPLLALDAGHGALSSFVTGIPPSETPNPAALAFFGGLAAELAAEVRTPSNLIIRLALGGSLGWSTAGVTQRRDMSLRGGLGWTF
jgi:hypothetical protein